MTNNIKISGKILSRYKEILSDEALKFIKEIHEKFNNKRLELLDERQKKQKSSSKTIWRLTILLAKCHVIFFFSNRYGREFMWCF